MSELKWYPANSADKDHPDEELDLDALGNPGGARWAWVADEGTGGPYGWCIYKYWLWEDIDGNDDSELAEGKAQTMEEGKLAVEAWVREHERKDSPVVKIISSRAVANCPVMSLSPEHYNDDGTCKCQ